MQKWLLIREVTMKITAAVFVFASVLTAQAQTANPLMGTSKAIFNLSKGNIMGSVDKIPEDLWSFQPTKDVRTVGQLFAHIADGQYEFCGVALDGQAGDKGIEKSGKNRGEIIAALKDAFAYCESAYAKLSDASAAETVKFFNMNIT